jgi:hypothetical protein
MPQQAINHRRLQPTIDLIGFVAGVIFYVREAD